MLLQEALSNLQAGKQMHRAAWDIKEGYLSLMPGMAHIWKVVIIPSTNAGNFIFSLEDLLADDWQEFQLPQEAVEAELANAA